MGSKTTKKIWGGVLAIGGVILGLALPFAGAAFLARLLVGAGSALWLAGSTYGLAQEHHGFTINQPSNIAPIPVIFGRAITGLRIADIRQDPNNEDVLYIVGAICDGGRRTGSSGGIVDYRQIYFDDRLAVNSSGVVQSAFSGYLTVTEYKGTDTQVIDSTLNSVFSSEWPTTSKGHSIAYLIFKLTLDEDVYPTGIPNIRVITHGAQVWDVRGTPAWITTHSTTPATPSIDNVALCIREVLKSDRFGLGCPDAELDDTSFADSADYCDDAITIPDGDGGTTTQKRFTCNGVMDISKPVNQNLTRLLSACGGQLIFQGGKFRLYIPQVESAETFELDESNIVGDWEFEKAGVGDVANIVEATFIDPDIDFQPNIARYPQVGVSNTFLTNDNDFEARRKLDLPFTNNIYMAEHICDRTLKESRNDVSLSVTVTEEALKVQSGEVVKVTHETPGFDQKLFRMIAMGILPNGNVRAVLKEYNATTYELGSQTDAATFPDSVLPNLYSCIEPTSPAWASTVTEAVETNSGKIARGKITWTQSADAFMRHEDVFIRVNGESEWLFISKVKSSEDPLVYTPPLVAGESYDIGIQAVNSMDVKSTITELLDQEAYDPDAYDPGQGAVPNTPSLVVLTATVETARFKLMAEIQAASTVQLSVDVTHEKTGDFRKFEYRFWATGEDKELSTIFGAEGDDQGSNVYRITHFLSQQSQKVNWNVEVRVRTIKGAESGWATDDDTASITSLTLDVDGARRGRGGFLPTGEPDPDRDPDRVRQRRSRDLFSGDGAPGGQSGSAGSGDTVAVSAEDIEVGSEADTRRPLKAILDIDASGDAVIIDPATATELKIPTAQDSSDRSQAGLESDGDVARDVPLAKAVANVDAIDTASGKIDEAIETKAGKTVENTEGSQGKADTAESNAASDATTKADLAESNAASDATTKADAAEAAAEATAASDATTKADAAREAAEATGVITSERIALEEIEDSPVGDFGNQVRGRDLFSGDGAPTGHNGVAGSGDTFTIDAEDIEIGSDKDSKLTLADETFQKSVDDLDDIDDGSTYKKTSANQRNGGGYAHTGLDSDGKVKLDVPLAYSAAELVGIDTATGKVDEAVATKDDKTIENTLNSQSKADAAQSAAESTASSDATTKADAAQAAAEATASADATTKADAAEAAANQETTDRGLAADGDFTGMVVDQRNLPMIVSGGYRMMRHQHNFAGDLITAAWVGGEMQYCTISVKAHDVKYAHGDVSYNAGATVTGLDTETRYYVYADDSTFAGGTVTWGTTTAWEDIIALGRYYVGTIVTPEEGGGGTSGGDGGNDPPVA